MDGIVVHGKGDAIAYPNHVRSIGAVIAPRRYRNMQVKPRGWNGRPIASECISIMPATDTSPETRTLFTAKRNTTTNIGGIVRRTSTRVETRAAMDHALMASMGTIHEVA